MKKSPIVLVALAASSLALAACSSEAATSSSSAAASSTSASASASSSMVGGMTTCDPETITAAVQSALDASGDGGKVWSLDGLSCDSGWAVAMPTVGLTEEDAVTVTEVFEAEGQFWVPKDRQDVCGTADPNDPTAYPSDALIPQPLYAEGCNTN